MSPLIGVYVHWPYCARICPYCDFTVIRDRGRTEEQARLGEAIIRDLEAQRALGGPRELVSIFFGGGTPSRMPPALVAQGTLQAAFVPGDNLEELVCDSISKSHQQVLVQAYLLPSKKIGAALVAAHRRGIECVVRPCGGVHFVPARPTMLASAGLTNSSTRLPSLSFA